MTPAQQAFYDLTEALAELMKTSADTDVKREVVRRVEAFKAAINPVIREHTAMVDAREAYLAANGTAPAAEEMARLCQRMSQDIVDVKPGTEREAFRALMRSSSHVIDACRSMVGEKILQRAKVVAALNKAAEHDNMAIDDLTSHRVRINPDIEGYTDIPNSGGDYPKSSGLDLINLLLAAIGLGKVDVQRNLATGEITFTASVQEFRS